MNKATDRPRWETAFMGAAAAAWGLAVLVGCQSNPAPPAMVMSTQPGANDRAAGPQGYRTEQSRRPQGEYDYGQYQDYPDGYARRDARGGQQDASRYYADDARAGGRDGYAMASAPRGYAPAQPRRDDSRALDGYAAGGNGRGNDLDFQSARDYGRSPYHPDYGNDPYAQNRSHPAARGDEWGQEARYGGGQVGYAQQAAGRQRPAPAPLYYVYDPTHPRADQNGYVAHYGPEQSLPQGGPQGVETVANEYGQWDAAGQEQVPYGQRRERPTGDYAGGGPQVTRVNITGQSGGYVQGGYDAGGGQSYAAPAQPAQGMWTSEGGSTGNTITLTPRSPDVAAPQWEAAPPRVASTVQVTPVRAESGLRLTEPAVAQQAVRPEQPYDYQKVLNAVQKLVQENPDDVRAQLALRSLYLALGQEDQARAILPDVSAEQQNRSRAIADAMLLASKVDDDADDHQTANEALAALERLSERLATQADLVIRNLKLCKPNSVKGFGAYEEVALDQLRSGQPQSVLVYCELENFQSERTAEGKYITRLNVEFRLYDSNYRVLAELSQAVTDVPSYNQRRDFFLRGLMNFPALRPGKYELIARIEDKVANKFARDARFTFEVDGP